MEADPSKHITATGRTRVPLLPQNIPRPIEADKWHCGVLFRRHALWIGAHYSYKNRRWCVNLVPFVTLWITLPGGRVPNAD